MGRWRDHGWWTAPVWGAVVAAPIAALIVLHRAPVWDRAWINPSFHFYVVSTTSLLAAVACGALAFASKSLRSTRLLFLASAFLSIAAIFSVHGLATPGFIHDDPYPAVGLSAWFSVLAGAVWVAASALEPHGAIARTLERHGRLVLTAVAAALGAYLFAALFVHESRWLSWIPIDDRRFQLSVSAASLALLAFGTWRYLEAYLFTRLPSQGRWRWRSGCSSTRRSPLRGGGCGTRPGGSTTGSTSPPSSRCSAGGWRRPAEPAASPPSPRRWRCATRWRS